MIETYTIITESFHTRPIVDTDISDLSDFNDFREIEDKEKKTIECLTIVNLLGLVNYFGFESISFDRVYSIFASIF